MAAVRPKSVYRSIETGNLKPVYYLTGDQEILKEELASAISQAAVDEGSRDFNVDIRAAGDLDGESFNALVETPPMLADRRLVIVKNLEQWRSNAKVWKALRAYLQNPSATTVLVLTHGTGKADRQAAELSVHVNVTALEPGEIQPWVLGRAEKCGLNMTREAAAHLVEAAGPDLAALAMEIEKLAAAAPTDRPLDTDDVSQIVGVRQGETLSDWVEAVLMREPRRAVSLIDVVLPRAGMNAVRMLMALGTALVGVRIARAALDDGKAPSQAENAVYNQLRSVRPPRAGDWKDLSRLWSLAARRWTALELDHALRAAYETDLSLKSTTLTDESGTLATLVLQLGSEQVAA